MPTRLISLEGLDDIAIDRGLLVIGRHRGCDYRIRSSKVSRRHCCLVVDRGGLLVRDLGSTNGIGINGRTVEVGTMATGDVLTIAHLRFRLTTETESARVQEEAECSTSLIDPLVLDELDQRPESGVGSEVSK